MAEPIVRNYTTKDIFTAVHTKGPTVPAAGHSGSKGRSQMAVTLELRRVTMLPRCRHCGGNVFLEWCPTQRRYEAACLQCSRPAEPTGVRGAEATGRKARAGSKWWG